MRWRNKDDSGKIKCNKKKEKEREREKENIHNNTNKKTELQGIHSTDILECNFITTN